MKKSIVFVSIFLVLALGIVPLFANGQGETSSSLVDKYPSRPVKIICPMSAGGDTDLNSRLLAKYLSKELDESFVVSNITGGGGAIGIEELKNSANDGYTLMVAHAWLHTNEAFGNLSYGYQAFEPISRFGIGTGECITVRSDFPANNIQELVKYTQDNPDKVSFGISTGATSHFVGVKFNMEGAKFKLVAAGNSADRVIELKAGRLDVISAAYPNISDYIELGDFKVLANCTTERNPTFPEIPTITEQGYNISWDPYYTVYAPKGTDPAIIAKIEAAILNFVNNNQEYAADLEKIFQKPYVLNTQDTLKGLAVERASYMEMSSELKASF